MALYRRRDLKKSSRLQKSAAQKSLIVEAAKSLDEDEYDIFLSHRSLDAIEVYALRSDIQSIGYSVYVDWVDDPQLDRARATKTTADRLRSRIRQCRSLLYAASANSPRSTWMTWELGFADGLHGRAGMIPVQEDATQFAHGQEYLSLYPYIDKETVKGKDTYGLWVNESPSKYVAFSAWLSGNTPRERQ